MRATLFLLLAIPAVAQAPAYKPFGVLADIMAGIMLPNSETIFGATRHPPKTAEQWTAVETSAVVIAEAGNLLLMPGRKKETGGLVPVETAEWKKHVQALVDGAKGVYPAAKAKNADAVFAACEPLYQACFTCHEMYRFCPTCPEAPPAPPAKKR